MIDKCRQLQGLTAAQLRVPQQFACHLPSAVEELRQLDRLKTPIEKLYCLKTTSDNISTEINSSIQATQQPGMPPEEVPCLTSDDLIPILVTLLVECKCRHIHSDIYYMENYYWSTESKDRDNLSYCLVTFKAAVQYMMSTDFDDLDFSKKDSVKNGLENTRNGKQKMERRSPCNEEVSTSQTQPDRSRTPKNRIDKQMENITKMLEKSMPDFDQPKQRPQLQPVASVFRGTSPSLPPVQDVVPVADNGQKKEQLGDFLSSLQDDMFMSCGKQS